MKIEDVDFEQFRGMAAHKIKEAILKMHISGEVAHDINMTLIDLGICDHVVLSAFNLTSLAIRKEIDEEITKDIIKRAGKYTI